jgi:hypothetical protein
MGMDENHTSARKEMPDVRAIICRSDMSPRSTTAGCLVARLVK